MKLFFLFLGAAAWQDLRTRSISFWLLAVGTAAGLLNCIWWERQPGEIILAMIPGTAVLLMSFLTNRVLGEGDGLFFVVSGFFLGWQEIILLFLSGQIFCSIFGLTIAVSTIVSGAGNRNIRKMRLPFLPFLIPAALWLVMMKSL